MSSLTLIVLLLAACAASALPEQTPLPTSPAAGTTATPTTQSTSLITTAPGTTCPPGSTIHTTTDCTAGTRTFTYCREITPVTCASSSFPFSQLIGGKCDGYFTYCLTVEPFWVTPTCTAGLIPYSTTTLYEGTLAGGESTTITNVYCSCASDQYTSRTILPGHTYVSDYCMPTADCPRRMTTSTRTDSACLTSTCASDHPLTTEYCQCRSGSTAVYPRHGNTETAKGCRALETPEPSANEL
jgi:hypothetical protein